MRRLPHPCSIRRPERLPSSYPSSGLMTACVGANPSPQSASNLKLTDSAPRDRATGQELIFAAGRPISKVASHEQPVARRRQLGNGKSEDFLAYDDLKLVNALEIEEA